MIWTIEEYYANIDTEIWKKKKTRHFYFQTKDFIQRPAKICHYLLQLKDRYSTIVILWDGYYSAMVIVLFCEMVILVRWSLWCYDIVSILRSLLCDCVRWLFFYNGQCVIKLDGCSTIVIVLNGYYSAGCYHTTVCYQHVECFYFDDLRSLGHL